MASTQTALSSTGQALHEIESTLGCVLFERTNQDLVPNDIGRCAIRYARLIHRDLAHLRKEMIGFAQLRPHLTSNARLQPLNTNYSSTNDSPGIDKSGDIKQDGR